MLKHDEFSRSTASVSQACALVSQVTWLGWLFGMVLATPHAAIWGFTTLDMGYISLCYFRHDYFKVLDCFDGIVWLCMCIPVACAIIGSRLDYCNSLLYRVSNRNINRLQHAQNAAARVVLNRTRFSFPHARPILKELHWLPINERIEHKLATLVFKTRFYHEPSYLYTLLADYVPTRSLRSSDRKRLLVVPTSKLVLGSRAFSVAAPSLWNSLPESVRMSSSVASFKASLKTHLYKRAFI